MGDYDHLIPKQAGPYDHLIPKAATEPEGPPAPTREQEIRRDRLKELMQREPGYLDRAVDQYTYGITRPLSGAAAVVEGKANEWFKGGKPATVGEYYRGGVGATEDFMDKAVENTPGAGGVAADLAGAVGSGMHGPKAATKLGQMGIAAVQGGIEGASRNAKDLGDAAGGAVLGAGTNAAVTGTLGALIDRFKGQGKAVRDIGEASRGDTGLNKMINAGAKLDKLDDAGIYYKGTVTPELANKVNEATAGLDTRGIDATLKLMHQRVKDGAMTFADVRDLQSKFSLAASKGDGITRSVAKKANDALDDFLLTAKPNMPSSSIGTVQKADLDEARKLYATGKHGVKIEGMAEAAADKADPAKATAGAFEAYRDKFIKNPEKFNPNNPEQKRLIEEIVATGKGGGKADVIDKWSNNLLGYGTVAGIGGAGAALGLGEKDPGLGTGLGGAGGAMLALGLLGKGASNQMRHQLARATADKVDDLVRNIMTGSTDKAGAYVPRNALATIMRARGASQGAGNYAGSFIDKKD